MRFASQSTDDLLQVAHALAQGRLSTPFSAIGLGRLGVSDPSQFASELNGLAEIGFRADQISVFLDALRAERKAAAATTASLELVVTGPDVREQARDTSVVVEQLFDEARISVLVVGFAVYKGDIIFRRLAERLQATPQLDVTLCLDVSRRGMDSTTDRDLVARYAQDFVQKNWSGERAPKVYFDPRGLARETTNRAVLHAKCVVVDKTSALITSANPTPAAYERNIEVGIIVRGGTIPEQIAAHFASLIEGGILKPLVLPTS